jgi:uncharacterized Ntn-hydrolase superfamily protein
MTFSLLAADPASGELGMIVSSSSPAVAARCAHVRTGIGVAASQNVTDPRLGPRLLDALGAGVAPRDAIAALAGSEPHAEHRQLAAVDAQGRAAAWSGARTLGVHATAEGDGAAAAGNLLADPAVPERMLAAFAASDGPLGDRLMAALEAGLAAGGEAGPVRSAGLVVAGSVAWPVTDLRVDWDDEPVARLRALWELWKPQADGYVVRALDPGDAPSFGVPGDE